MWWASGQSIVKKSWEILLPPRNYAIASELSRSCMVASRICVKLQSSHVSAGEPVNFIVDGCHFRITVNDVVLVIPTCPDNGTKSDLRSHKLIIMFCACKYIEKLNILIYKLYRFDLRRSIIISIVSKLLFCEIDINFSRFTFYRMIYTEIDVVFATYDIPNL